MKAHRFRSMGCEVVVTGADPHERSLIERLFAKRDRRFSRFLAGSELNRVNACAGRPVRVSREFAAMLALALAAAEQTGGLVDPTLGAAVTAAGYDRDFDELEPGAPLGRPRTSELPSLRFDGRLLLVPRTVELDLNGVVKGKTVDDALALIAGDGYVSAGGDLAVRGGAVVSLPGGGAVTLAAGALATSGRDRRTWTRGGAEQHHLIDPRSGRPAESPWRTVTACGATCVGADVAAKVGFLLSLDGPIVLAERGVPARFVDDRGAVVENELWRTAAQEAVACT